MMTISRCASLALLLTAVACGGDDDDGPGGLSDGVGGSSGSSGQAGAGGSTGGSAGSTSPGGASGSSGQAGQGAGPGGAGGSSAGAAGASAGTGGADAGSGGVAGGGAGGVSGSSGQVGGSAGSSTGGTTGQGTGGAPTDDPVCAPGKTWGEGEAVAGLSADAKTLVAVSPDERWLLYTTSTASTVYLVGRASADVAFGAPLAVPLPAGYGADGRVGLSPDGLALVVSGEGETGLGELRRVTTTDAFPTQVDATPFALPNQVVKMSSRPLVSPVFTASGQRLYATVLTPNGGSQVASLDRSGATWAAQIGLADQSLAGPPGDIHHLTGIAPDGRALFFDLGTNTTDSLGVWSTELGSAVQTTTMLAGKRGAVPVGAACERLYYWSPSAGVRVVKLRGAGPPGPPQAGGGPGMNELVDSRYDRPPLAARRLSLARRRTPHSARRTPHAGRRTPDAARRTPDAVRRSPLAARRTPHGGRRSADAARRTPHGGRRTPDSARRTPDSARRTPDTGHRTPDAARRTADGGRRTADGGRRTADGGRRTPDAARRTADAGRRTPDAGRRTPDAGRRTPDAAG